MSRATDNEAFVKHVQGALGVPVDGWAAGVTRRAFDAAHGASGGQAGGVLDRAAFFADARVEFGSFQPPQVQGIEAILDAVKDWPISWQAYALATSWHETGETMQPIKEKGGAAYFKRMYDIEGARPAKARELGNVNPGDGARYAGRGYVQLTGRTNYQRYRIADTPDDAMKPDVAAHIMRDGMERGIFTGKKLADYLPGDYAGARRIINGQDKAPEIAAYARRWEASLRAGGLS